MSLDSDTLLDRKRLKRDLIRWRVVAVFAVLALAVSLFGEETGLGEEDHIARLSLSGIITDDRERNETLYELAEDMPAKALIVHINSPGGTVVGGETLYHALRSVSESKPVAVVMDEVAASAGYMTAIAGDRIFAHEGTVTGSIGVIWQTTDLSGLLSKLGVTTEAIKSGPLKAAPSPLEPLTPEVREATLSMVIDIFDMFVDMVAERRNLTREEVLPLADGRVFTGRQALEEKLVDEIGGEREALAWLAEAHGINADLPVNELKIKRADGVLESFFSVMVEKLFGKTLFSERVTLDGLISLWHAGAS